MFLSTLLLFYDRVIPFALSLSKCEIFIAVHASTMQARMAGVAIFVLRGATLQTGHEEFFRK
jgi:hypothetical protein